MNSNEKSIGKVPPQNIDAEKSLIGAILLDEGILVDVAEITKPLDFYDKRHAQIYAGIIRLFERHKPVDLLTLTDELKKKNELDSIGGSSYLAELTNYVPTAAHAKSYAEIISQAAIRRRLIKASADINDLAFNEELSVPQMLGQSEAQVFSVSDNSLKQDLISLENILGESLDRLDELFQNKGKLRGIRTGYRDLDNITAGLQRSNLIILAARPAMGKTTLVTNLAYNVAVIERKPVLFFSLEMSKEQLTDRMIADKAGVDSHKLQTGNLNEDDFAKLSEAMGEMAEAPFYIDDTPGITTLELRTKARRIAHEGDLGLIVVDYLQLLEPTTKTGNRVQEVSEISRSLKLIARELNVPVIALSQLSRQVENREDKRPQLADLRESGSIEQDADLVMFIFREAYYNPETERENITDLIISKNRHGSTGTIELYFHPELLRFVSLDRRH